MPGDSLRRAASYDRAVRASLALATALWLVPSRAFAQPLASRVALLGELRAEVGTGDVDGLSLAIAALGAEVALAPSLQLRATGVALVPFGATRDGRSARGGGGGELALHLTPFPSWRVRPFVRASAGLLFFLRDPFLPGGDVYEFMLDFGGGVEVSLGERVVLGLHAHYSHLSNGQGLGPFNPAFDGLGVGLDLRYALAPRPPFEGSGPPAFAAARPSRTPGFVIDGSVGAAGGALLSTGRLRVAERVSDHLVALFDGEAGSLAREALFEAGLALAGHWGFASAGAHVGYRNYVGIETLVLVAQAEAHVSPEVSFVAMGAFERSDFSGSIGRAAVAMRAFPFERLLVELGVGFDRIGDVNAHDVSDPYFAFEWQLPVSARDWQLSLFVDSQVSTIKLAGLRVAWGMGTTLRDQARRMGWRRVR